MKYTFLCLFILGSFCATAQIVNIPDPNFKDALVNHDPVIDTNGDGEIQVTEAEATIEIFVFNKNISDLTGVEAFINLRELKCQFNSISQIDTSPFPFLEILRFSVNNVTSVDVSQNQNLLNMDVDNNPISTLNLSTNTELIGLNISETNIATIDLSQNDKLQAIRAVGSDLTAIDVSNMPDLVLLSVFSSELNAIDLSANTNLQVFDASGTNLIEINVENNPDLRVLDIFGTNVSKVNVSSNSLLEILNVSVTGVTELDVSSLSNLKRLDVTFTDIQTVDVSNNPQLCRIDALQSEMLTSVNLQNGSNTLLDESQQCVVTTQFGSYSIQSGVDFRAASSLNFICVDDIAFAEQNFINVPPQSQFTEDCSLATSDLNKVKIELFPNPTSGILKMNSNTRVNKIELLSIHGTTILTKELNASSCTMDLSAISSGTYFVKIIGERIFNVFQIVRE